MLRGALFSWTVCLLVLSSLALAQRTDLAPEVAAIMNESRAALQEALETYERHYPDKPLWREAIRLAQEATDLAPDRPEPLRLLAEVYTRANWYGPAWEAWSHYLEAGYDLDAGAAPLFLKVGNELGYARYQQEFYDEALTYYERLIEVVPYDKSAFVWSARILQETGQPEAAIPYWEIVVGRDVTDERARYFLELAQDQADWGMEAVKAFREGVELYDEDSLDLARERFARAVRANPDYPAPWAWLGRIAFESENYRSARRSYEEAVRLEPDNETYQYFLEESQRRMSTTAGI